MREAIRKVREVSGRRIIYRPKPSWESAKAIEGTEFMPNTEWPVEAVLRQAWCVVTHHSNVAGDGLIRGVPCLTVEGVAEALAGEGYEGIDDMEPPVPERVQEWARDVAYCQWNVEELASGECWRHLKDEGLV